MAFVLILEDDAPLRRGMGACLRDLGHRVLGAGSVEEARCWIEGDVPDLLVLDLFLPGEDGLDLLRRIKETTSTRNLPVLVVSGRDRVQDRILGLETGADDYLVKPFDIQEFCARAEALLRRVPFRAGEEAFFQGEEILQAGDLLVDRVERRVWAGLCWVPLTPLELHLLCTFLRTPGVSHTQEDLLRLVWNQPPGTGNPGLVRWAMKRLRAKIERDPSKPRLLRTRPRKGYVYEGPELHVPEGERGERAFPSSPDLATALVAESPVGVLVLDRRGRCVFWNRRASALLGHSAPELLGLRLHRILLLPREVWLVRRVAALLRGDEGAAGSFPVEMRHKDGRGMRFFVSLFSFPLKEERFAAGILHPLPDSGRTGA